MRQSGFEQIVVVDITRADVGIPVVRVIVPRAEIWTLYFAHGDSGKSGTPGVATNRVTGGNLILDCRRETAMKTIVFSGPSIAEAEVHRLAACTHAPPIKRGDLAAAGDYDVFVILDGEFGQNMSVSPKEILAVLERGKTVIGASSMGALRASELDRSGMIGVGWVYDYFRRCAVRRDADVALVYSPFDFKPMTVPMVDRRILDGTGFRGGTDRQQGKSPSAEGCPEYLLCRSNAGPADGCGCAAPSAATCSILSWHFPAEQYQM